MSAEILPYVDEPRPAIDPHPLSDYVAWAGRRNRNPILEVFQQRFPSAGDVLELASGAGLHVNYFAPHFPGLTLQPSDLTEEVFAAIKAKRAERGNANVLDPIRIDLTDPATFRFGDKKFDAIFVINIFQVAPVAINEGIAALAAQVLKDEGRVYIYGPFKVDGRYTTDSNRAFDQEILAANVPEWGLKDVRDLEKAAKPHGIVLKETIERPANNFILVFGRQ
ncbi:class I SAM-dependent methyltransferase [Methylobacterium sp. J-048]|uniref:DUF938 domain-containing protein n=1 Tax=Methylobacterium sp. J-048 TaxID=2836635 RepID=UPI001FB87500|nr:DUF938 domain-containing protein [Methylobacterium sp. J-048]MCJ2057403.1 class I SAM-dependent methyltransferase [Methylobacterium sp. J-048]